ncbi:MAG: hypothetical protein WEE64_11050 [Dehalococcoidia bacterium]
MDPLNARVEALVQTTIRCHERETQAFGEGDVQGIVERDLVLARASHRLYQQRVVILMGSDVCLDEEAKALFR